MLVELYENPDLSQNFETDWFAVDYSGRKPHLKTRSLNVVWENVEGNLKGQLEIYTSPDRKTKTLGAILPVSGNTNIQDASVLLFCVSVPYVKFWYSSNGTTSGKIRVFIEIQ